MGGFYRFEEVPVMPMGNKRRSLMEKQKAPLERGSCNEKASPERGFLLNLR
jgi:hypothetical protein